MIQLIKSFEEQRQALDNLEANLAPDARTGKIDSQKVTANLANFARTISGEKGVLTNEDIARVAPKSGATDLASLIAYFKETPSEELPGDFTQKLNEMIMTAKRNMVRLRMQKLKDVEADFSERPDYAEYFTQDGYGTSKMGRTREYLEGVYKDWDKPLPWEPQPKAPGQPPGQQDPANTVDQKLKRLEELRRKQTGIK